MSATVSGLLFWPKYKFVQGAPLDTALIKTKRVSGEVRDLLTAHPDIDLSISGHLRGIDGAGSSLDIPEFQQALTGPGAKRLREIPSTPTIASDFRTTVRFELCDDPEVIEYVAPDYGITGETPHRTRGRVILDAYGKTSQTNGPAFVFRNLFRLSGIRIVCEETSPMALAGGMESSSVFNVALIAAASMLSGADLSMADIFSLAVKMENDELNGLTGGQGHLCCMLGGAYRHVWLSGIKDREGRMSNPYGAFSLPLLPDSEVDLIEEHVALVQAGKTYRNGRPLTARTASLINWMWTDLLRDRDRVGLPLLQEMPGLAERFTCALKQKDFNAAAAAVIRYVEIRDALCIRWINLALDAREEKAVSRNGDSLPSYASGYARKIFAEHHPLYADHQAIRDFYVRDREAVRKTSFYTLSPIAELVKEARRCSIAVMPLGAGGPGANLVALSVGGGGQLKNFLEARGLPRLNEDGVRSVVRGSGTLKGYMPFRAGKEPLAIKGFRQLGLKVPEAPVHCLYNQRTGEFIRKP